MQNFAYVSIFHQKLQILQANSIVQEAVFKDLYEQSEF